MSPRRPRKEPSDHRHATVKSLLAAYWSVENPDTPDLPWGAAEAGCVGAFLRAHPSISVGIIDQCLQHRLTSDDHAPGEGIYRWFRDLLRYKNGPLDRFRLPKKVSSEATVGMQSAEVESKDDVRAWFLERAKKRKDNGSALDSLDLRLLHEEGLL
ncbi:hypothetical protein H7849_11735 [Alloacidobacterium dinghuense]|uniref:Uncharacterized protein n=1 Tax=Alloacidobacterium dinghuense TaxID=2763107 RepID=A0A7G8BPM6_9BACT|nr:hypothetical protein [Alloacidobacterium dinghuense]QNI34496.1 hypothetical protein H7849_11735 [Alloacidobacterium dinghuense]